jgi:PPM family protein phosphatase
MQVDAAAVTHAGQDPQKQVNEDSFFRADLALGYLAIVCDGMGGHRGGKEASELAVATIVDELQTKTAAARPDDLLRRAIERANERVFALGGPGPGGRPGSTIVLCLFTEQGAWIAHVGDSRVYRVRANSVESITRDHSAVRELVDAGVLTLEQAKHHPEANKITRALGAAATVEVEINLVAFAAGDTFVLCSDGLSDLLENSDLLAHGTGPLQSSAQSMVDLANTRGGHDNITALLVRPLQGSRASATTLISPPVAEPSERSLLERPQTEIMPRDSKPTVVMAPLSAAAMPQSERAPHVQIPPNRQPPPPVQQRSPLVWIAIILSVILLTALVTAALVLHFTGALERRPQHVPPSVPVPPQVTASATAPPPTAIPSVEDDAPVPTLAPVKPAKPHRADPGPAQGPAQVGF